MVAVAEANALPGRDRISIPAGTSVLAGLLSLVVLDDLDLEGAGAGVTTLDGDMRFDPETGELTGSDTIRVVGADVAARGLTIHHAIEGINNVDRCLLPEDSELLDNAESGVRTSGRCAWYEASWPTIAPSARPPRCAGVELPRRTARLPGHREGLPEGQSAQRPAPGLLPAARLGSARWNITPFSATREHAA